MREFWEKRNSVETLSDDSSKGDVDDEIIQNVS